MEALGAARANLANPIKYSISLIAKKDYPRPGWFTGQVKTAFSRHPEPRAGSRSGQETGGGAACRPTVRVKSLGVFSGDLEAGFPPDGEEGIGRAGAFHPAAEIFSALPEHIFSREFWPVVISPFDESGNKLNIELLVFNPRADENQTKFFAHLRGYFSQPASYLLISPPGD